MTDDELRFRLESYLEQHDFGSDGSHDISHLRRVRKLSHEIAQIEGQGDQVVLTAASYLHDIINLPKNHPQRTHASQLSADAAQGILTKMGLTPEQIILVQGAILTHSFSAGFRPETIEARILQDADRIEALGAIGIARLFYVAGSMGSRLFDPIDPLAKRRELDDKKYAVDHFFVKLFRLPDMMQTNGGRKLAQGRVEYMKGFVSTLIQEL